MSFPETCISKESLPHHDFRQYCAARKVADIFFENYPIQGQVIDLRKQAPDPFLRQTNTGLILEFFKEGLPTLLWTPWGKYQFAKSVIYQQEQEVRIEFLERFTRKLGLSLVDVGSESRGPLYAVLRVEGQRLPSPKVRGMDEEYLDPEEVSIAWEELSKKYGHISFT